MDSHLKMVENEDTNLLPACRCMWQVGGESGLRSFVQLNQNF